MVTFFSKPANVAAAKLPANLPTSQPKPAVLPSPLPVITPPPSVPAVSPELSPTLFNPQNYNDNLAMLRKAVTRNTMLDNSRFRNVIMANIVVNDLLGPREDYLKYGAATMLEMHVKFPNCWNRQDPSNPANWVLSKQGGWFYSACKENATTPNIEYIIQYPLERDENTAGWYIASDVDPMTRIRKVAGGSTVHADWWGGWNASINKRWIDNCVNFKTSADDGCGFGYLSDGSPDKNKPLLGPALKFRQKYPGPFKLAAASLYKQLCDPVATLKTPEQAAYCKPAAHKMP